MVSNEELANIYLNSDAVGDDYFIAIVENKLKVNRDKFTLKLVLLSPATGQNENFVAVLYRAKIKIEIHETKEIQSVDVIIKVLLSTLPEMKEFGVFPRERFFYENVLSSFEEIWLERAGEVVTLGPRMIKTESDPYEQIVLDDLKAEGFEMLNRKVGANLDQTKAVLKKISQFHAASAVRYQKDGMINSFFNRKETMTITEDNSFAKGIVKVHNHFLEAVKGYGDCDEFVNKIAQWDTTKLFTTFTNIAEPMRSGFQVLNHGDMWLNNMMFKLDSEGKTEDVSLIDYQIPYWGGPAGDLLYFLTSSVADDIKIKHFDEFIAFYHKNLVESLKKLKYDQRIPTLAEVHVDLLDKGTSPCCNMLLLLFVVKDDSSQEINLEKIMSGLDDPELLNRVYNNENYKKAVKELLPFLNNRGYLDKMIKQNELNKEE